MLTLAPIVFRASGLLNDPLCVNQTPMVGSVDPLASASWYWFRPASPRARRRAGRGAPRARLCDNHQSEQVLAEIEASVEIEAVDRPAIIEQGQQVDLGRAQIDQCGLQVGLVLQALQFEAVEIDAGDVSGLEAVAADFQDLVVVVEIVLRELKHSFGLQDADECAAQIEEQIALRVGLLSDADGGALLGGFVAESALVAALEEIADAGGNEGSGKGLPHTMAGSDLGSVGGQREVGIGAKVGRDFLRLEFVDIQPTGLEDVLFSSKWSLTASQVQTWGAGAGWGAVCAGRLAAPKANTRRTREICNASRNPSIIRLL